MTNLPLVSVAMVTYNSSPYIRMAIESVLSSSYNHLELIISDDSSTDNTWEIIQSFSDDRIKAFRNTKNIGEYTNRNQCINLANGKYLLFIDGDDVIYPHGLEFMVRMLDGFPDCKMALLRWFRNKVIYPITITSRQFYLGEYFGHGFLGTSFANVLFRLSTLKEAGGLPTCYKAGDNFIRYKIALMGNILLINDGMTWWRETPGQASSQFKKSFLNVVENYKMKLHFLNETSCPLSKEEINNAKFNLYLIIVKEIYKGILKGRIRYAYRIFINVNIPLTMFFKAHYNLIQIDPFENYSSSNPFYLPFKMNPLSIWRKL